MYSRWVLSLSREEKSFNGGCPLFVSAKVFTNNMSNKTEPQITKCKSNENWTKVTFKPDLSKFNMNHLEADVVALMSKRVMDIAGCLGKGVKVELNGQRLPIKSFQDYVGLYLAVANSGREEPLPRFVISGLMSSSLFGYIPETQWRLRSFSVFKCLYQLEKSICHGSTQCSSL